ncbi:MAG: M20 family peptidase [Variovorax sp.]
MIKRILLSLFVLLLLLAAAVAANTLRQGSHQLAVPPAGALAVHDQAVAETLAQAIRFRTISSHDDAQQSADEFRKLHAYLEQRFPKAHAALQRETVGDLSLLYTWPGTDPKAYPILLMAHQDVVPIAPGTERTWQAEPFSGTIRDGFVWGRGAWDDKGNLVAQLQAVEMLVASGFRPRQTVYIAAGADEEVGGRRGAAQVVQLLQRRNVRLDFVIDEGLLLTEGLLPGLSAPAALIGVAEKGYITVHLKVVATPGHASMPPPPETTAIAMMSAALGRLQNKQFPAELRGVARELFETLAPEMTGLQRVALSNLWLFGPLVEARLARVPSTNAMLRTTTALTVVNAGNKFNVIPGQAEAILDFRILPGDTRESVLRHVRSTVGDSFEVKAVEESTDPTPVSSTHSASYQMLERTLRSVFPGTLVAPALFIAGSDSRHFVPIADNIYRFSPLRARPEDLSRFHGTDERIAISNLAELVRFYHQLIRNAADVPVS